MRVELVTRNGCHLCEEALATLREIGVEPVLRNVDQDDGLFKLYDWRVPVILADGLVVAEGKIRPDQLRRRLSPR